MTSLRILVVEDHRSSNSVLCFLLEKRGHRVTGALTAREALEAVRSHRFDLAIIDLGLPDDNGWNLLVKLRQQIPSLPAIALSGHRSESDLKGSEVVGIAAHLVKPIAIGALEAAIARAVPARATSPAPRDRVDAGPADSAAARS